MRLPLRNPKATVWYVALYGPAVALVGLGVWIGFWADEWASTFAYCMAALNIWIIGRRMRASYQSGYWRGRLDAQMEQWHLKAPRRVTDPEAEPWDEQPSIREATALRAAMDAMTREQGGT